MRLTEFTKSSLRADGRRLLNGLYIGRSVDIGSEIEDELTVFVSQNDCT